MALRRHRLEIVASCIFFGLMSVLVRLSVRHGLSAWEIVDWRMAFGTVGILPLVIKDAPRPKDLPRNYPILAFTVVTAMATVLCYLWSISMLPVGLATLFYALNPIIGVLFAAWLLREPLNWMVGVGLALALFGIALTVSGVSAGLHFGIAVGLLASVFQGGSLPLLRQVRKSWTAPTILFWSALGTTLACLPAAYRDFHSVSTGEVALLLGVGATGLTAQLLLVRAMGHLSASQAAVFIPVTSVTGLFLGVVVVGEPLTVHTAVGAAVMLTGVVLGMRATVAPPPRLRLALRDEAA